MPDLNKIRIYYFFKNGINLKTIATEMTIPWNETTLPTLLSNYKLEDIFSANEFSLFYQCPRNKTFHLPAEKCSGG